MLDESLLVLYVEDDAPSRGVMTFIVTRILKHRIEVFETTENFLDRLRALPKKPDVIFLDIHIGPLDGYAVLELLRKEDGYEKVPVIAMTASVTSVDVQGIRAAGYYGLIGKPIRGDVFPSLFKRILAGEPVWFII